MFYTKCLGFSDRAVRGVLSLPAELLRAVDIIANWLFITVYCRRLAAKFLDYEEKTMGGLFGGGSGAPSYIPVPQPVQARSPESVDANKAVSDTESKIKKQLAAKTSMENNISTSPLGVNSAISVQDKVLLGQ